MTRPQQSKQSFLSELPLAPLNVNTMAEPSRAPMPTLLPSSRADPRTWTSDTCPCPRGHGSLRKLSGRSVHWYQWLSPRGEGCWGRHRVGGSRTCGAPSTRVFSSPAEEHLPPALATSGHPGNDQSCPKPCASIHSPAENLTPILNQKARSASPRAPHSGGKLCRCEPSPRDHGPSGALFHGWP